MIIRSGAPLRLGLAGGGGVMTLLVDPARRVDVLRARVTQPGSVMICHFTKWGTEGWEILR
jgi:D-glycero-alpha-D-manno-heptose-7-phosphate kinase